MVDELRGELPLGISGCELADLCRVLSIVRLLSGEWRDKNSRGQERGEAGREHESSEIGRDALRICIAGDNYASGGGGFFPLFLPDELTKRWSIGAPPPPHPL